MNEEMILEFARLEREAIERVLKRNAELQLGEAFKDLENEDVDLHKREG